MIYIGNHLSSSKGFEAMGKAALKLGANTFAFSQEIQGAERRKRSIRQMRNGYVP